MIWYNINTPLRRYCLNPPATHRPSRERRLLDLAQICLLRGRVQTIWVTPGWVWLGDRVGSGKGASWRWAQVGANRSRLKCVPEAATCHQTHSLHISPSNVCAKFSQTCFEGCLCEPLLNHHFINHHLRMPKLCADRCLTCHPVSLAMEVDERNSPFTHIPTCLFMVVFLLWCYHANGETTPTPFGTSVFVEGER